MLNLNTNLFVIEQYKIRKSPENSGLLFVINFMIKFYWIVIFFNYFF